MRNAGRPCFAVSLLPRNLRHHGRTAHCRRSSSSPSRPRSPNAPACAPTSRAIVADVLVTGDLLGHTTHGLALLAPYLAEIEKGSMAKSGEPSIVNSRPAAQTWDGGRLPGPWLTLRALDAAATMAADARHRHRRHPPLASHRVPRRLSAARDRARPGRDRAELRSDRLVAVVPHGGLTPIITPNPIAAGLPTSGDPILIDISSSITSMGFALQQMKAGKKLPGAWLIDHEGNATDDPGALVRRAQGRAACRSAASTPATRVSAWRFSSKR